VNRGADFSRSNRGYSIRVAANGGLLYILAALFLASCSREPSTLPKRYDGQIAKKANTVNELSQTGSKSPTAREKGKIENEPQTPIKTEAIGPVPEVVSRRIDFNGTSIHYLVSGPENAPSLLLLHGASFHSGTWQTLGTIALMASKGYRVVALDLPGFGKSEAANVDQESFLEHLIPRLGLDKPVVVAPSMSGRYAFPLLQKHPEAISGFVGVAPAAAPKYAAKLVRVQVPSLIVWGEADTIFPPETAERLSKSFNNVRVLIIPGAGHACYLDQPAAFHEALLQFLQSKLVYK
jgi:abhydrolase domain-containing protein 14